MKPILFMHDDLWQKPAAERYASIVQQSLG
jgi:hypothetical protein